MNALLFVSRKLIGTDDGPSKTPSKVYHTPKSQSETLRRAKSCNIDEMSVSDLSAASVTPKSKVNKLLCHTTETPRGSRSGNIASLFHSQRVLDTPASSSETSKLPAVTGHQEDGNGDGESRSEWPTGAMEQSPSKVERTPTRGPKANIQYSGEGGEEQATRTRTPSAVRRRFPSRTLSMNNRNKTPERSRRHMMREQARERHELRRQISRRRVPSQDDAGESRRRTGSTTNDEPEGASPPRDEKERSLRPEDRHSRSLESRRKIDDGKSMPKERRQSSWRRRVTRQDSARDRTRMGSKANREVPNNNHQTPVDMHSPRANEGYGSGNSDSEKSMTFSKTVIGQLLANEGIEAEEDFEVGHQSKRNLMDVCPSPPLTPKDDKVPKETRTSKTPDTAVLTSTEALEGSAKEDCQNSSLSSGSSSSSKLSLQIDTIKIRKHEKRQRKRKMTRKVRALDVKLNLALNAIMSARAQVEKLKKSGSDSDSDSDSSSSSSDSSASLSVHELLQNSNKFSASKRSWQGSRISVV